MIQVQAFTPLMTGALHQRVYEQYAKQEHDADDSADPAVHQCCFNHVATPQGALHKF